MASAAFNYRSEMSNGGNVSTLFAMGAEALLNHADHAYNETVDRLAEKAAEKERRAYEKQMENAARQAKDEAELHHIQEMQKQTAAADARREALDVAVMDLVREKHAAEAFVNDKGAEREYKACQKALEPVNKQIEEWKTAIEEDKKYLESCKNDEDRKFYEDRIKDNQQNIEFETSKEEYREKTAVVEDYSEKKERIKSGGYYDQEIVNAQMQMEDMSTRYTFQTQQEVKDFCEQMAQENIRCAAVPVMIGDSYVVQIDTFNREAAEAKIAQFNEQWPNSAIEAQIYREKPVDPEYMDLETRAALQYKQEERAHREGDLLHSSDSSLEHQIKRNLPGVQQAEYYMQNITGFLAYESANKQWGLTDGIRGVKRDQDAFLEKKLKEFNNEDFVALKEVEVAAISAREKANTVEKYRSEYSSERFDELVKFGRLQEVTANGLTGERAEKAQQLIAERGKVLEESLKKDGKDVNLVTLSKDCRKAYDEDSKNQTMAERKEEAFKLACADAEKKEGFDLQKYNSLRDLEKKYGVNLIGAGEGMNAKIEMFRLQKQMTMDLADKGINVFKRNGAVDLMKLKAQSKAIQKELGLDEYQMKLYEDSVRASGNNSHLGASVIGFLGKHAWNAPGQEGPQILKDYRKVSSAVRKGKNTLRTSKQIIKSARTQFEMNRLKRTGGQLSKRQQAYRDKRNARLKAKQEIRSRKRELKKANPRYQAKMERAMEYSKKLEKREEKRLLRMEKFQKTRLGKMWNKYDGFRKGIKEKFYGKFNEKTGMYITGKFQFLGRFANFKAKAKEALFKKILPKLIPVCAKAFLLLVCLVAIVAAISVLPNMFDNKLEHTAAYKLVNYLTKEERDWINYWGGKYSDWESLAESDEYSFDQKESTIQMLMACYNCTRAEAESYINGMMEDFKEYHTNLAYAVFGIQKMDGDHVWIDLDQRPFYFGNFNYWQILGRGWVSRGHIVFDYGPDHKGYDAKGVAAGLARLLPGGDSGKQWKAYINPFNTAAAKDTWKPMSIAANTAGMYDDSYMKEITNWDGGTNFSITPNTLSPLYNMEIPEDDPETEEDEREEYFKDYYSADPTTGFGALAYTAGGHVSNIRDVVCMTDVRFGMDMGDASVLTQNSDKMNVEGFFSKCLRFFQYTGAWFTGDWSDFEGGDETPSYKDLVCYADTIFSTSHQISLSLELVFLPTKYYMETDDHEVLSDTVAGGMLTECPGLGYTKTETEDEVRYIYNKNWQTIRDKYKCSDDEALTIASHNFLNGCKVYDDFKMYIDNTIKDDTDYHVLYGIEGYYDEGFLYPEDGYEQSGTPIYVDADAENEKYDSKTQDGMVYGEQKFWLPIGWMNGTTYVNIPTDEEQSGMIDDVDSVSQNLAGVAVCLDDDETYALKCIPLDNYMFTNVAVPTVMEWWKTHGHKINGDFIGKAAWGWDGTQYACYGSLPDPKYDIWHTGVGTGDEYELDTDNPDTGSANAGYKAVINNPDSFVTKFHSYFSWMKPAFDYAEEQYHKTTEGDMDPDVNCWYSEKHNPGEEECGIDTQTYTIEKTFAETLTQPSEWWTYVGSNTAASYKITIDRNVEDAEYYCMTCTGNHGTEDGDIRLECHYFHDADWIDTGSYTYTTRTVTSGGTTTTYYTYTLKMQYSVTETFTCFRHVCKGHIGYYCGGHIRCHVTGLVYSFTKDQTDVVTDARASNPNAEIVGKVDPSLRTTMKGTEAWTGPENFPNPGYNIHVQDPMEDAFGLMEPEKWIMWKLALDLGFDGEDYNMFPMEHLAPHCKMPIANHVHDIFEVDCWFNWNQGLFPERKAKDFTSWDEDTMTLAINKYEKDWIDIYDFDVAITTGQSMLAAQEVTDIIKSVEANPVYGELSDVRRNALQVTLEAVGNGSFSYQHHAHGYCMMPSHESRKYCQMTDDSGFVSFIISGGMAYVDKKGLLQLPKYRSPLATTGSVDSDVSDAVFTGSGKFSVFNNDDLLGLGGSVLASDYSNARPGDILVYNDGSGKRSGKHSYIFIGILGEDVTIMGAGEAMTHGGNWAANTRLIPAGQALYVDCGMVTIDNYEMKLGNIYMRGYNCRTYVDPTLSDEEGKRKLLDETMHDDICPYPNENWLPVKALEGGWSYPGAYEGSVTVISYE